mmetsp:Transcript_25067/g.49055  ORF Transcript_25067/g.49055 Transcript_25067/m.49055 type:complete len:408 (-) Transcript_25067:118-1341(-)
MVMKVFCLACFLLTVTQYLIGCGGGGGGTPSTTATTTVTTTTIQEWDLLEGADCSELHGAISCHLDDGVTGGLDLAGCKQKCIEYLHCEGFAVRKDRTHGCWLKYDVRPDVCTVNANVNTYVYNARVKRGPNTTTTTTAITPDAEVVQQVNEKYNNGADSGLFVHCTDFDSGVESTNTMISFSLVNKVSWMIPNGPINIYAGGTSGVTVIGTPNVKDLAVCYYPCDGASDKRARRGCGVPGPDTCSNNPNQSAWCSFDDNELEFYGSGRPCAFQPSRAQHAMELFKKHKTGEPWKLRDSGCKSQYVPPPKASINEVVLDGEKWNNGIKDYIWAYVITDMCNDYQSCKSTAMKQYNEFTQKYGKRPLLYMDRCNAESPFSVYSADSHSIVGPCPPQPGPADNSYSVVF